MKPTSLLAPVVVTLALAAPRAARADLSLNEFARAAAAAADNDYHVPECLTAYDQLHAQGTADTAALTLQVDVGDLKVGTKVTIGQLHDVCLAGKYRKDVYQFGIVYVGEMIEQIDRINAGDAGANVGDLKKRSAECAARVDALLAEGALPTTPIKETGWTGTLGTAKAEVCQKGQPAIDKWMNDNMAPYVKAGLKADKMRLLLEAYPEPYYLAGGKGTTDAKKLARANVWFWDSPDDNAPCGGDKITHTLHRYQFDKAQQATETSAQFCGDPPGRAYR
jgi:hypothetical protein